MVVKMTSASGCLPLTIPKAIRRTRAEAGLGEGAGRLKPENPESYGDSGLHSVRQAHCLHQALAQRGFKAMFVLPQWCLGLQPCTSGCRESEHMAGGRSPSFPSYLKVCCAATMSSLKRQKQLSWIPPWKTKGIFNDFFRHARHSCSLSARSSGDNAAHERAPRRLAPSLLILQRAMQRKDSVW